MKDSNLNGDGTGPSLFKLAEVRPDDAPEYAALYAGMGLGVVPNRRGRKRPTVKGWPELKLGAEDVPHYFSDGQNVGLLLGEHSGGLVDVDLDCAEARAAADFFLPDTLASGRRSAPRSHRFVISPGARSISYKMPGKDGPTILEVRSTGAQTLVEPSIHPTGECYEWDRDGVLEPAEFSMERLELSALKIATAAVIARRLPAEGRHHFALALAGHMLRPGRSDEETVLDIMLAAWHAAGANSPETLDDVERAVRDTASKIVSGDEVIGGPTLEETATGLVPLLDKWWGWRQSGDDPAARWLRDNIGIYTRDQYPYLTDGYEVSPWVGTSEDILHPGAGEGGERVEPPAAWPSTPEEMDARLKRTVPAMQQRIHRFFDPGLDLWHEETGIPFRKGSDGPRNDAHLHAELWKKEGTSEELWVLVALKPGWSPPDREIEEAVWHYALTGRGGGSASRLRTDDSGWHDEDPDDLDIFDMDD